MKVRCYAIFSYCMAQRLLEKRLICPAVTVNVLRIYGAFPMVTEYQFYALLPIVLFNYINKELVALFFIRTELVVRLYLHVQVWLLAFINMDFWLFTFIFIDVFSCSFTFIFNDLLGYSPLPTRTCFGVCLYLH